MRGLITSAIRKVSSLTSPFDEAYGDVTRLFVEPHIQVTQAGQNPVFCTTHPLYYLQSSFSKTVNLFFFLSYNIRKKFMKKSLCVVTGFVLITYLNQ